MTTIAGTVPIVQVVAVANTRPLECLLVVAVAL
jgi:hypothetical protein